MPELPEVETARRIIESTLVGARLIATEVRLPKLLRYSAIPDIEVLDRATMLGARRRAKVLITDWSGDLAILFHFKLSGQISVQRGNERRTAGHPVPDPDGPYPHKATHISFDVRLRLGSPSERCPPVRLDPDHAGGCGRTSSLPARNSDRKQSGQGPSRLEQYGEPRAAIDPGEIGVARSSVVAGIGNIYVDEALHRARIHPMTPARDLPAARIPEHLSAIQWAIENRYLTGRREDNPQQGASNRRFPRGPRAQGRSMSGLRR